MACDNCYCVECRSRYSRNPDLRFNPDPFNDDEDLFDEGFRYNPELDGIYEDESYPDIYADNPSYQNEFYSDLDDELEDYRYNPRTHKCRFCGKHQTESNAPTTECRGNCRLCGGQLNISHQCGSRQCLLCDWPLDGGIGHICTTAVYRRPEGAADYDDGSSFGPPRNNPEDGDEIDSEPILWW